MEPSLKSQSQAGQDLFVLEKFHGKRSGTFLDLGAGHPVENNNTILLEKEYGWTGVSVDRLLHTDWNSHRGQPFCQCDLLKEWPDSLKTILPPEVDYLSLDIDEDTNSVLPRVLENFKFGVITIEHDLYARGDSYRKVQHDILLSKGYVLVKENVTPNDHPELPFEDWWIHPDLVPVLPLSKSDALEEPLPTPKKKIRKRGV